MPRNGTGLANVGRFWVDEVQEHTAILSGRFRESGLATGELSGRHFNRRVDNVDFYLKRPHHYKSKVADFRLAGYRHNKLLYLGDHYDVFRYYRYLLDNDMMSDRQGGFVNNRNKLIVYVAINILGLAARKLADVVAVETPEIKPWKEADAKVEGAIDRIMEASDFPAMLYGTTLNAGIKGDQLWTGMSEDGPNGKKVVKIKRSMPELWFPDLDHNNLGEILTHNFAWKVPADNDRIILRRIVYIPGGVVNLANWIEGEKIGFLLTPEEELKYLGGLPEPVNHNVVTSLVTHIPNLQLDEQHPFGLSDFVDVKGPADELAHRLTQLAVELDKHANLSMKGPDLGKGESVVGRYFTYQKDEPEPDYITLPTGALEAMHKEIDMHIKWILLVMELSPGLVGLQEGGGVERAEALRIKNVSTGLKSMRKQIYLTRGIQHAFKAAMELENFLKIDSYEVNGVVGVNWKDGLPDSPTEKATLMALRTNNQQTISRDDAIRFLDGDSADQIISGLEEEKDAKPDPIFTPMPTFDPNGEEPNVFGAPPADEE
jgi:hypothetical protein